MSQAPAESSRLARLFWPGIVLLSVLAVLLCSAINDTGACSKPEVERALTGDLSATACRYVPAATNLSIRLDYAFLLVVFGGLALLAWRLLRLLASDDPLRSFARAGLGLSLAAGLVNLTENILLQVALGTDNAGLAGFSHVLDYLKLLLSLGAILMVWGSWLFHGWQRLGIKPDKRLLWLTHLMPGLVALMVPAVIIGVLESNTIDQVSDLLSPQSDQSQGAMLSLPFKVLGESSYPLYWLLIWGIALVVWFGLSWLIYLYTEQLAAENNVGQLLRRRDLSRATSAGEERASAETKSPGKAQGRLRKLWASFWRVTLNGNVKRDRGAFALLLVKLWGTPLALILGFTSVYHLAQVAGWRWHPEPLAIAFGLFLLIVLSLSLSAWLLASYAKPGLGLRTLTLLPFLVLFYMLFGLAPITDQGKRMLNSDPSLPPPTPIASLRDNEESPIVILTLAGGGTRAALFGAGVLSQLWWGKEEISLDQLDRYREQFASVVQGVPLNELDLFLHDPIDSGARTVRYYPGRLFLIRLDAISSVSGGSLAAGYFVERLREIETGIEDKRPLMLRAKALKQFFENCSLQDFCETKFPEPEIREKGKVYPAAEPIPNEAYARANIESNPFIRSMALNHLAAVATGIADPLIGRGPSLEEYWNSQFDWGAGLKTVRLGTLASAEATSAIPHLMLNSTNEANGGRVVLTNLDARLLLPGIAPGPQSGDFKSDKPALLPESNPTHWKGPPHSIQSMDPAPESGLEFSPNPTVKKTFFQFVPTYDPPLAQAIHASANFPFGFPLMRFSTQVDPTTGSFSSGEKHTLELVDGGILDNTGMDTALALIRHERDVNPNRRIVLLVADSSELAVDHADGGWLDALNHNFTGDSNAIWRAGQTAGSLSAVDAMAVAAYVEQPGLREARAKATSLNVEYLRNWPKSDPQPNSYVLGVTGHDFAFFRVRLGDFAVDHVPTSWHLSLADRQRLYGILTRQTFRQGLLSAAKSLTPVPRSSQKSQTSAH